MGHGPLLPLAMGSCMRGNPPSVGGFVVSIGNMNGDPLGITEKHGLTDVYVHCDLELSEARLAVLNGNLQKVEHRPVRNRRSQLRWATRSESEDYWEFLLETRTMTGAEESLRFHLGVSGRNVAREVPKPHLRSRRTIAKVFSLVEVLSGADLTTRFDCHLTWHSSSENGLRPDMLPSSPAFPEDSVIRELTGVIGGSSDGNVKFVVDRVTTESETFHIWLGFQWEATFTAGLLVEAINRGSSMLEDINLWES